MTIPDDDGKQWREAALAEGFGSITEALLEEDLDLVDVLDRLVVAALNVLEVDAAAVVLQDDKGNLVPVASSNEEAHLLELFQLRIRQGPCLDAIREGTAIVSPDLDSDRQRWPDFV